MRKYRGNFFKLLAVGTVLFALLCAAVFWFWNISIRGRVFDPNKKLVQIEKTGKVFEGIRDGLKEITDEGGINGALDVVNAAFLKQDISIQQCHIILHDVGHFSYLYYGGNFEKMAERIDKSCLGAYQHGLDAQIVLSSSDPVADLKKFCEVVLRVKPGFACYHGVGHEVFRTKKDVNEALKFCDQLAGGPEKDLSVCWRGAFSEFANAAINFDTDFGTVPREEPLVKIDTNKPYEVCVSVDSKYRVPCYQEMTKVYFAIDKTDGIFNRCLENPAEIQKICIRGVATFYAWSKLYKSQTISAPNTILSLSEDLRKLTIDGIHEMFVDYAQTGQNKDYAAFCLSFKDQRDVDYCRSLKV